MSHEHELMTQLRDARKARARALAEEEDAALVHAEKRSTRRKTEADIEEILHEIETGKSSRPIIDHINGRADVAVIEPDLEKLLGAEADADDPPADSPEWTSADLERELLDAVKRIGPSDLGDVWAGPRRNGCDDEMILEILRSIWPYSYMALTGTGPWGRRMVGKTVHGGPTPAFWIGARKSTDWKLAPPQLQGLELADRVRTVLKIPRMVFAPGSEPEPVADGKPARKPRRKGTVPS